MRYDHQEKAKRPVSTGDLMIPACDGGNSRTDGHINPEQCRPLRLVVPNMSNTVEIQAPE